MSELKLHDLELSGNCYKVRLLCALLGLKLAIAPVDFLGGEHKRKPLLAQNPFAEIPVLQDGDLALRDSQAILVYLAEKTGRFLPKDPARRYEALQWLIFQVAGIGPMFGQVGFFHKFAGRDFEDRRPRDRYVAEARRLLAVLELRLGGRKWIMGDDYTIADIAVFPWVRNLIGFYAAGDLVGITDYPQVLRALEAFMARPAVVRGLGIPAPD